MKGMSRLRIDFEKRPRSDILMSDARHRVSKEAAAPGEGQGAMSQRPPRPRAFRLDDARVAVDDGPAPFAPQAVIQSQHEPIPPASQVAPIDEAERQVEAAQKSGLIARSRLSLAGLAWSGLAGLASLAFGLWTTNLIEGCSPRRRRWG